MANQEHLQILSQGAQVWNDWLQANPGIEPDLSNTDLRKYDINGCFFTKTNFSNCLFFHKKESIIPWFRECDFTDANFNDSIFWKRTSLFVYCNLLRTQFRNCQFDDVVFSGMNMAETDFSDSNFHWTIFSDVDCTNSKFVNVKIYRGKYVTHLPKKLAGADFSGVNLNNLDLSDADLTGAIFTNASLVQTKFNGSNLTRVVFRGISLIRAEFSNANLTEADFSGTHFTIGPVETASYIQPLGHGSAHDFAKEFIPSASLIDANFEKAILTRTNFTGANLIRANFAEANLTETILEYAVLSKTNLEQAVLNNCPVYGISAWDVEGNPRQQTELLITPRKLLPSTAYSPLTWKPVEEEYNLESGITVDNLQLAQFLNILINNSKLRQIIDTVTQKVVLILGRFTPERKAVLDALRDELRKKDYLPVIFDFDQPSSRNLTETVATLAHLSKFIIADITDAKSIPQELQATIPHLPSVPFQPLLLKSEEAYAMFEDYSDHRWVLKPYLYNTLEELIANISQNVITPSEKWLKKRTEKKLRKQEKKLRKQEE